VPMAFEVRGILDAMAPQDAGESRGVGPQA
jgi:hypothetical protein